MRKYRSHVFPPFPAVKFADIRFFIQYKMLIFVAWKNQSSARHQRLCTREMRQQAME